MKMYPLMDADSGSGGGGSSVPETVTNDPVPQTQVPSTPAPVTTPQAPAGESAEVWMTRYKGMQTAYNKLKGEKDILEGNHNTAVGELQIANAKIVELEGKVKELDTNLTGEKESAQSIVTESTQKDNEIARLRLIIEEFPDLVNFEKSKTLPVASDPEELKTKFAAFRETIKTVMTNNTQQALSGSSLPSGVTNNGGQFAGLSIRQMQDRLNKLAGRNDKIEEYLQLRDIYDKAVEAANPS